MIISLKTHHPFLISIMNIPLIGAYIILLLALLPVLVAVIVDEIWPYGFTDDNAFIHMVVAFYNLILSFIFKIRIAIIFIPCWLIFLVVGISKFFNLA
ncbi:MAG: hypothetical protein J6586_07790 [Snodgrassella sp.]|uniref:hypothetical protein n=1 Tax=Snodgrassella sp. TaxID=2815304 RepID=UPI00259101BF|nr:hypothetical protein [Snodgrassella sp.]MCO6516382.1 hypothetical protein [Snodgrassella sp.]MCO6517651.1 hypothetical protein [Snodgrassella sp.]MCO6520151.1 hypothetical protein [Snodgrassella sp.]MCO6522414.1 hypothetical protein [Snodgrassella sp.]